MDEIKANGRGRGDHYDALVEFGKKSLTGSVCVIQEHIKLMIPLTTGLITAYFALLKFLGIDSVLNSGNVSSSLIVVPTFFMLGSLICFVITSFPVLKRLNVDSFSSIISYRNFMVAWRYVGAGLGMGLFLYGLFSMINMLKIVLENL